MPDHKDLALTKRHPAHNWEYADSTARLAATGFVAGDVNNLALQLSDNTLWLLADDSPITWVQVNYRLGTSATTAAAGNDSRLSDARTPTGAAGGVLGGTYPNPSFAADMATQAELDAHVADTTAAHAASAIAFTPAGTIAATTVQAAIEEVASEAGAGVSGLDDLADVNAPSPSNGDVLTWDSTPGEWVATSPGALTADLDDLGDVNAPTPSDGDVLTWDSTPGEWVAAAPTGGGGGAPTTVPYVTTASDGTLSAEVVIPGLAGSPDVAGAAGGGFSEEYDSGTSGLTWTSAPTTEDVHTTVKSHLYLATSGTGEKLGYKAWSPAGDFDIRAKVTAGSLGVFGIIVMDSTNANRLLIQANGALLQTYTYAGSYTGIGSLTIPVGFDIYLRIKRVGTGITFYYSFNGKLWHAAGTATFSITVARRGFRIDAAAGGEHLCDWVRGDV